MLHGCVTGLVSDRTVASKPQSSYWDGGANVRTGDSDEAVPQDKDAGGVLLLSWDMDGVVGIMEIFGASAGPCSIKVCRVVYWALHAIFKVSAELVAMWMELP